VRINLPKIAYVAMHHCLHPAQQRESVLSESVATEASSVNTPKILIWNITDWSFAALLVCYAKTE